jgi:AcrR family transcriptional regulator
LGKVVAYAAEGGIADRSLREIAAAVGSSHRMLLYHFGSREGLMAAIVAFIEEQQRAAMVEVTAGAADAGTAMIAFWQRLTAPELRPFIRLFFAVFGLAVQGTPGAESMLENLTGSWLESGAAVAAEQGYAFDAATLRLSVAVARGLLIDLLAGADPAEVAAAYARFVELAQPKPDER